MTAKRPKPYDAYQSTKECWRAMRDRCLNKNAKYFYLYGGAGITICARWLEPKGVGFDNFVADMGTRPPPDPIRGRFSLDRVNNDSGYSKANCRWTDGKTQARNKSNNRILEWNGQDYCLADLAEQAGVSQTVFSSRLRANWDLDKIMTTAAVSYVERGPMTLQHAGREHTLEGWALQRDIPSTEVRARLLAGWEVNQALDTPAGFDEPTVAPPRRNHSPNKRHLTGRRFGMLKVLSELPKRGVSANARWLCVCDCGELSEALSSNLGTGKTESCGCMVGTRHADTTAKWQATVAMNKQPRGPILPPP